MPVFTELRLFARFPGDWAAARRARSRRGAGRIGRAPRGHDRTTCSWGAAPAAKACRARSWREARRRCSRWTEARSPRQGHRHDKPPPAWRSARLSPADLGARQHFSAGEWLRAAAAEVGRAGGSVLTCRPGLYLRLLLRPVSVAAGRSPLRGELAALWERPASRVRRRLVRKIRPPARLAPAPPRRCERGACSSRRAAHDLAARGRCRSAGSRVVLCRRSSEDSWSACAGAGECSKTAWGRGRVVGSLRALCARAGQRHRLCRGAGCLAGGCLQPTWPDASSCARDSVAQQRLHLEQLVPSAGSAGHERNWGGGRSRACLRMEPRASGRLRLRAAADRVGPQFAPTGLHRRARRDG